MNSCEYFGNIPRVSPLSPLGREKFEHDDFGETFFEEGSSQVQLDPFKKVFG